MISPDIAHKHLIIRAEVMRPVVDPVVMDLWMDELITKIKMTKMMGPFTKYCGDEGNRGITSVAIITTSHIAVHMWDEVEPGMLQMDLYSCKDFDLNAVFEHLQVFQPRKAEYKYIDRETGLKQLQRGNVKQVQISWPTTTVKEQS
jgi:S-adenosylmethionine/arginine decarboxylase-like enzyme